MDKYIAAVEVACAFIILYRTIFVGHKLSPKEWTGHPLQFIGLSVAYPLMTIGAIGKVLGTVYADVLLLLGITLFFCCERRSWK